MADCNKCKRTDIKCCPTCARNPYTCNVWHHCGKDCEGYEPRIKSQADRIRAMSDEELAELLSFKVSGCQMCIHRYVVCVDESFDCKDGVLQWLKSEVKE